MTMKRKTLESLLFFYSSISSNIAGKVLIDARVCGSAAQKKVQITSSRATHNTFSAFTRDSKFNLDYDFAIKHDSIQSDD